MKRLFMVVYIGTQKRHQLEGAGISPYFEAKQEAKKLRDRLNDDVKQPIVCVSYGPDHRHYTGGKK